MHAHLRHADDFTQLSLLNFYQQNIPTRSSLDQKIGQESELDSKNGLRSLRQRVHLATAREEVARRGSRSPQPLQTATHIRVKIEVEIAIEGPQTARPIQDAGFQEATLRGPQPRPGPEIPPRPTGKKPPPGSKQGPPRRPREPTRTRRPSRRGGLPVRTRLQPRQRLRLRPQRGRIPPSPPTTISLTLGRKSPLLLLHRARRQALGSPPGPIRLLRSRLWSGAGKAKGEAQLRHDGRARGRRQRGRDGDGRDGDAQVPRAGRGAQAAGPRKVEDVCVQGGGRGGYGRAGPAELLACGEG